jgi:neopullulanase
MLLGSAATTAQSNFDPKHPLYELVAALSTLRKEYPALRRGKQIVRNYGEKPGLFAVSRIDPATGREIVVAFNTSTDALKTFIEIDAKSSSFKSLHGVCPTTVYAPGSMAVTLAPFDFIVCEATR